LNNNAPNTPLPNLQSFLPTLKAHGTKALRIG